MASAASMQIAGFMVNENLILTWAAGTDSQLPDVQDLDEQRLYALLTEHRLTHRFLHRFVFQRPDWCGKLVRGVPAWCSRHLLDRLFNHRQEVNQRFRRQLRAFQEIRSCLSSGEPPLILAKGAAIHALTGENRHIRFARDLDLFFHDPERLKRVMEHLGYSGEKLEAGHEYAILQREDIVVEIHRYFPVHSYPSAIEAIDLNPASSPLLWFQNLGLYTTAEVGYWDLAHECIHGKTKETKGMVVPNPCLSVLLLCSHIFKNYVEPAFWRVHLSEAANVFDLVHHPDFEKTRFVELVERFHAVDAVGFVGILIESYLGRNPFSMLLSTFPLNHRPAYPQLLTMTGGWAALRSVDECLSPRDSTALMYRLGATTVVAARHGLPVRYEWGGIGERINRIIVQTYGRGMLPLSLSVSWDDHALNVVVRVMEPLEDDAHDYNIQIHCDGIFESVNVRSLGTKLSQKAGGAASLTTLRHGYEVQLPLNWDRISERYRQQGVVPLVLEVSKWHRSPGSAEIEVDPLMVLPLVVVQEDAQPG